MIGKLKALESAATPAPTIQPSGNPGELAAIKAERDALKAKLDEEKDWNGKVRIMAGRHGWHVLAGSLIHWLDDRLTVGEQLKAMLTQAKKRIPTDEDHSTWRAQAKAEERERIIALLAEMGYLSYEVRSAIEIQGEKK